MTAFVTGPAPGSSADGWSSASAARAPGVRALARSEASARRVAALGADPVRGDIGDRTVAGSRRPRVASVAFHLAAHLGEWGSWEHFERGNVEGTRNVLAACAEAGVARFVHCGTEAALMAGEPLVHVDETAPLRPDSRAPYPATKARAEQAVRDASREKFETVVVRPRFVWGRGDTTLLPGMVETVAGRRFAWVGAAATSPTRPMSTTWSRACCSPLRRAVPARPTSSPTASRSSSASSSPRCWRRRASSLPTAASLPGPQPRWPASAKPPGSSSP